MHPFRKILNDPLSFKKYYSGLPANDQNNLLKDLLLSGKVIEPCIENPLVYTFTHAFDAEAHMDIAISQVSEFLDRTLILRDELAFYDVIKENSKKTMPMVLIFAADFKTFSPTEKTKYRLVKVMKERMKETPYGDFTHFMSR